MQDNLIYWLDILNFPFSHFLWNLHSLAVDNHRCKLNKNTVLLEQCQNAKLPIIYLESQGSEDMWVDIIKVLHKGEQNINRPSYISCELYRYSLHVLYINWL